MQEIQTDHCFTLTRFSKHAQWAWYASKSPKYRIHQVFCGKVEEKGLKCDFSGRISPGYSLFRSEVRDVVSNLCSSQLFQEFLPIKSEIVFNSRIEMCMALKIQFAHNSNLAIARGRESFGQKFSPPKKKFYFQLFAPCSKPRLTFPVCF